MGLLIPQGSVDDMKSSRVTSLGTVLVNTDESGDSTLLIRANATDGSELSVDVPLGRPGSYSAYTHGWFDLGRLRFHYNLAFPEGDVPSPTLRLDLVLGEDPEFETMLIPSIADDGASWKPAA